MPLVYSNYLTLYFLYLTSICMDKSYENDMQYPEYMENGDVRG